MSQFEYIFIFGGLGVLLIFTFVFVAYYLDSLNYFYYKKVNFKFDDLEITYWYKWKLLASKGSPFFIWRKVKIVNHSTNQESEHEIDPVSENGHVLYFYIDHNYKTSTGMLFDAIVIRDSDVSMGFDLYSTDYLGKQYVYEKREESTEYMGMIEQGIFYKSEGMYRNVESKELNY
ncbi:MAG: hypothetical protein OCD76_14645 [Reichenbachiella sp.]